MVTRQWPSSDDYAGFWGRVTRGTPGVEVGSLVRIQPEGESGLAPVRDERPFGVRRWIGLGHLV